MKHWQQNKSECILAAACMAYDLNYPQASHNFEVRYGKTWIIALTNSWSAPQCFQFLEEITGISSKWCDKGAKRWKTPGYITRPPLGGQGILTINCEPGNYRHAVAWGDGMIYDGNAAYPLEWDVWASCYPTAWLDGWHPRKDVE